MTVFVTVNRDSNTAAPSTITDPFLPVLLATPPSGAQAIPTLGECSLALLRLLAGAMRMGALRRRGTLKV